MSIAMETMARGVPRIIGLLSPNRCSSFPPSGDEGDDEHGDDGPDNPAGPADVRALDDDDEQGADHAENVANRVHLDTADASDGEVSQDGGNGFSVAGGMDARSC